MCICMVWGGAGGVCVGGCKTDTVFVVEQLVGKYRVLWLDQALYLKRQWLWNHLPAASSAVHRNQLRAQGGLVLVLWCTEHTHTQLLFHFPPRTMLSLHTKKTCPAELLTNQIYCCATGTGLLCPSLDYASPLSWWSLSHHLNSTTAHRTSQPQHTAACSSVPGTSGTGRTALENCRFHKVSYLPGLGNTL